MRTRRLLSPLALGVAITMAFLWMVSGGRTPSVLAATQTVENRNDSGTGSLRQAIIDASSGDTITFSLS